MSEYIKLNDEPIDIEYVEDEHDTSRDFTPSFWYWNKRYYIGDFIRVHNNPWINDDFPENIHGIESENYYNPIFIEVIDGEQVNVYKEGR